MHVQILQDVSFAAPPAPGLPRRFDRGQLLKVQPEQARYLLGDNPSSWRYAIETETALPKNKLPQAGPLADVDPETKQRRVPLRRKG